MGCEILAIAPRDDFSFKLEELGCKFVHIPIDNKGANPIKDLSLFFNFIRIYKKYKPDMVLHYTIKPNTYGSLACKALGIACISNVSGLGTVFIRKGWVYQLAKILYRISFLVPQRVFFQNNDDRQLFIDLNLVKDSRTGILPGSGINTALYRPVTYKKHFPFRFLLIARLLNDKGIAEFANASKILQEKGYEIECKLLGFYDRESVYNISREDIAMWSEKGYINFIGESKDVFIQINEADCVVLPSYREGTPRSLLEAMALEKPIIGTDVPGCREVVEEGKNGYMCLSKSAESLADTMLKIYNLPEDKLIKMGKQGRLIAETKFDERIVVESYLKEIFGKKMS